MGQQMQFRMQSKAKKDRQMRGMQFHSHYLHRERDRDRLLMHRHASQQPDNHPEGQTVQLQVFVSAGAVVNLPAAKFELDCVVLKDRVSVAPFNDRVIVVWPSSPRSTSHSSSPSRTI